MTKLYQAFDVDERTPVQWLAVHPLRWNTEKWGEPAIMFREVDDETQNLADAAPDLLDALEAWMNWIKGGNLSHEDIIEQTNTAIAKARGRPPKEKVTDE